MKNNKLLRFAALFLAGAALMLLLSSAATRKAEGQPTPRFRSEWLDSPDYGLYYRIITDTATGVQYLFVRDNNAGGLTVLQEGGGDE